MHAATLVYGFAVAWFTHTCFRIASLIYQFETFARTYGSVVSISLRDLAGLALDKGHDLPNFKVVVPAYHESAVIEATVRRLAAANYPCTHFELYVVTYEDEPVLAGTDGTCTLAERVATQVNCDAGRALVRVLRVPAAYDGYFPGSCQSRPPQIGKPRGLNFALRSIHEENERDERTLYLVHMRRLGLLARVDAVLHALHALTAADTHAAVLVRAIDRHFTLGGSAYIGALATSAQARQVLALALRMIAAGQLPCARTVLQFLRAEASRFFLQLLDAEAGPEHAPQLATLPGKEFLHEVMSSVEAQAPETLERTGVARTRALQQDRAVLGLAIEQAGSGEALWQCVRRVNSRWLMVYDADADAPADLMRHLAANILSDPTVMGFQGPVAPVANLDAVHPLCKLGGLWMGFWHGTTYPRLMGKPSWAHPLAGTNWCFRIEGFERDGCLVREDEYDESRRRFLLSFDPEQLTEDLEAGVRLFSDWKVNAQWHPYLELEQVPPTPRGLVVQRTRWTLGTLQTLRYIVRSRLPVIQRARFALHPIEIVFSGSGPLITLLLWALILSGELMPAPTFLIWTIILTLGNLLYVASFLRAYARFEVLARQASGVGFVRAHGPRIAALAQARLREGRLDAVQRGLLRDIAGLLAQGLAAHGFIATHLRDRCLDDDAADAGDACAAARWTAALRAQTPACLSRGELPALARAFAQFAAQAQALPPRAPPCAEFGTALQAMQTALTSASGLGARHRRLRTRAEIWFWTFPYLFFQLVPYFKGLVIWLRGGGNTRWHKTPRTPKATEAPGLQ